MFTQASKRYCFSTPFSNQRVNGFETLLKSARHRYFPLFPRIRDKLSWKKFAWVTSEIFLLFVNTLTPDEKYSRRYMETFWQQVQTLLSQKERDFFKIFYWISEMCMKFRTFWKKGRVSEPNYYRNYCIRKRCLLKPLKGLASADHSVINGLTGSKHCWSQQGTTIFNFYHESEINWVGKSLP